METLGWSKGKEVKVPFFIIAENKHMYTVDTNGVIIKTDQIPTALSVLKTGEEIKQVNSDSVFMI